MVNPIRWKSLLGDHCVAHDQKLSHSSIRPHVVCIASGPSLTARDCDLVEAAGHSVIAVNNSYLLAPFADVLYAGDRAWWAQYGKAAKTVIAECWTASPDAAERFGVHYFEARDFENSGYQAIELAVLEKKADRVILLGYRERKSI
jgi:hypothetical protein